MDFLNLVNYKKHTQGHGSLQYQLTPHWRQKEVSDLQSFENRTMVNFILFLILLF